MDARKAPTQQAIDALVACYSTGDFATAKQLAFAMSSQYPGFAFGWKILGAVLSQSGQLAEALELKRILKS